MKLTVRTWRLAWWGYLVTWSDDDVVLMYAITTTSWWFRPRILIHQIPLRLGKTPLAALREPMGHRAWLGSRRFGYVDHHYFGNPGGYRDWYVTSRSTASTLATPASSSSRRETMPVPAPTSRQRYPGPTPSARSRAMVMSS
ncbi:hypothetical protein GCM10011428_40340 [Streptomyces violaceus]